MKNSEIIDIKLYNTKGILLRNFNGVLQLDLSKLKSGFYLLVFKDSANQVKRQLITV